MRTNESKEKKKIRKKTGEIKKWKSGQQIQDKNENQEKNENQDKLRSEEKIRMRKKIDKWVVLFPSKHFIFQDIIWANL